MRRYGRNVAASLALALAMGFAVQANTTNFSVDVGKTIDASIQYFRTNNYFTNGGEAAAQGLVLLVLLEKHASADFNAPILGYSGLAGNDGNLIGSSYGVAADTCHNASPPASCPTQDKLLAQYSVQRILDDLTGQYAYYDGQYMMALSEYLKTGGQPNVPNTGTWGASPTTIGTGSVKAKLDAMVDRTLAAQCTGSGATLPQGFWSYSGCGQDASTTQFAIGGMAAARDFYTFNGTDAARVTNIIGAIGRTRNGYALHMAGVMGNEGGWGYSINNGAGHQQTASGMWVSVLGGADINDAAIQRAINFERNHYDYFDNNTQDNGWGSRSYGYHLFSSSKAFSLLEAQNTPVTAGNTATTDLGADPAAGDRLHRRDPNADGCARLAAFGVAGCAGGANATPYAGEQGRWYYDYAYTIMSRQQNTGFYTETTGGPWDTVSNQAYYTLVLQRSLAGVNNPPDCSSANTYVEIPVDANHAYSAVSIGPVTDIDNEVLTIKIDAARMDEADQWGGSFPFPAQILAANGVQTPAGGGTVNNLIQVRAERDGLRQTPGNGRVYHIKFTATDTSGGSCSGEAKVGVRYLATQPPIDDYPGVDKDATQANPQ